jgi:hypothetical protein
VLNAIHTGVPIAKGRELLLQFGKKREGDIWKLSNVNPAAHSMLKYFLDVAAGQKVGITLGAFMDGVLTKLGNNLSFAILSANIRAALIQPTAILQTTVEIGPRWAVAGVKELLKDVGRPLGSKATKMAFDKSNVLISRSFDTAMADLSSRLGFVTKPLATSGLPAVRAIGRGLGGARLAVGQVGLAPLKWLDMITAKATWLGAYRKATELYGLGEKMAIEFADDVVVRTQASGLRIERSPLQQHALGKSVSLLNTFIINQWGWLTKEVLGVSQVGMSKMARLKKIATLVTGASAINYLYEDVLGTQSPVPNPTGEYARAIEEGRSEGEALWQATGELVEVVPIVGGAVRWGSALGGPILETFQRPIESLARRPTAPAPGKVLPVTAGRLLGVPGVSQISKATRGIQQGAQLREVLLGRVGRRPPRSLQDLKRLQRLRTTAP